jgi:peptide/nickel transport system substrate-binding protein
MRRYLFGSALLGMLCGTPTSAEPRHGIAMHGQPKHAATMAAFPYVNPGAPKGGRLSQGIQGTYDSLNPLSFKGESASGVRGYIYESLLVRSDDEPFSLYGLIAESIDVPDDRRSATFVVRKEARFSDGKPVTIADVQFSFELLREKGWPGQRDSLSRVSSVEVLGERQIRFTFKPDDDGTINRELPLIIGLMAILPAHAVDRHTFEQTTLTPPIGSGPYTITRVDPGRLLIFTRNKDWWAKDLAVTRGRYNFNEIRHEYFRDPTALFEAFKTGALDVYEDADPVRWANGYDIPSVRDGRILKREFTTRLPAGMSALVFNTRRAPFDDIRVRRALIDLFDATWINRNLYAGMFKRTESFFERSDLSSFGRPADAREIAMLSPFPGVVTPGILDGTAKLAETDGSGSMRQQQRAALALLSEAGYKLEGQKLVHTATRKPLAFEMLASNKGQERLINAYSRVLDQIGISLQFKLVESSQYEFRLKDQNFDMIQTIWAASLSPGVEQRGRFGSGSADRQSTRNYAGVKSPAADAMIRAMLAAREREDFTSAVRAYDRVLRSGSYVLPLFHLPRVWVAHSSAFKGPDQSTTNSGYNLDAWWSAER